MAAQRKATATWNGDLNTGGGTVNLDSSGAASNLAVTWASRTEDQSAGKTSPEELVAAAYAACFSMALSAGLAKGGNRPERLTVEATASFGKVGEGFAFNSMTVRVRGRVPGIDQAAFEQAADTASKNCPISRALKGNVEISVVDATLE